MTNKTKKRKAVAVFAIPMACLFASSMPIAAEEPNYDFSYEMYGPVTVMIDAGHGGIDSGAIGANGVYEKDLSLQYAQTIGAMIQSLDPSISVLYTRYDDQVPWVDEQNTLDFEVDDLNGRTNAIMAMAPTYVLSVHFNAADDPSASGFCGFVKGEDASSQAVYSKVSQYFQEMGYSYDRGLMTTMDYPLQIVDMNMSSSMLLELGFLTNYFEVSQLSDPSMMNALCMQVARAYVDTIHGV